MRDAVDVDDDVVVPGGRLPATSDLVITTKMGSWNLKDKVGQGGTSTRRRKSWVGGEERGWSAGTRWYTGKKKKKKKAQRNWVVAF